MMQFKPFMFINRLVIKKEQYVVYDQLFHKGVNIIRGKNSVGKSTLMEFIFFALGGAIPIKQWKPTALLCSEVFIELNINNEIFTLQRNVSTNTKEGMRIFQGKLDNFSIFDSLSFPYSSTDKKKSFHNNLIEIIGIPETKSGDSSFINFHQILRLIYTDQLTSVSRIFREEDFDSNLKRETIGDLILGITDVDILSKKLELMKIDKELNSKIQDIRGFLNLYQDFQKKEDIELSISENLEKINNLSHSLEKFSSLQLSENDLNQVEFQRNLLAKYLEEKNQKIEELNNNNFEIIDSEEFVKSLRNRLVNIHETEKTLNILTDLEFSHCPSCFTRLAVEKVDAICKLCGTVHDKDYESPTYRIRKNIEFQIEETISLLPYFKKLSAKLEDEIVRLNTLIENCKTQILLLEKPQSGISVEQKKNLLEIGSLKQENIHLTNKLIQLDKFYKLQEERDILQITFNDLDDEIKNSIAKTESTKKQKEALIANKTLELIKKDLDREESFANAEEVTFSFSNDTIKVDGISLFSASSTALLKTCFKIAILIASCENATLFILD